MRTILHRANTATTVRAALERGFAIETDVRAFAGELYAAHDPIRDPRGLMRFEELVDIAGRAHVFVNVKEDGLASLFHNFADQLPNAVYFDMSVPELVRYSRVFPKAQLAARLSDVEPYPNGVELCDWLWVDCFSRELTDQEIFAVTEKFPRKIAFVSPELHGRNPKAFWGRVEKFGDAYLCTDFAEREHD